MINNVAPLPALKPPILSYLLTLAPDRELVLTAKLTFQTFVIRPDHFIWDNGALSRLFISGFHGANRGQL